MVVLIDNGKVKWGMGIITLQCLIQGGGIIFWKMGGKKPKNFDIKQASVKTFEKIYNILTVLKDTMMFSFSLDQFLMT